MIVLLEYSGTFVPENPVSLPLSENDLQDTLISYKLASGGEERER